MAQKPAKTQSRLQSKPKASSSKLQTVKLGSDSTPGPPLKKFKPLNALASPTVFDIPGCGKASVLQGSKATWQDVKGKRKADATTEDDRLWVDIYEPTTEEDLAVHKKKVEDVRRWLIDAFEGSLSVRKHRRILALTGPSGTGKTTTLRVLALELGLEILEWKTGIADQYSQDESFDAPLAKFESFLTRASTCHNIFQSTSKKQLVLLEDIPNIFHESTQSSFQAALRSLSLSPSATPLVIIISDAGLRGEAGERHSGAGVMDVRSVLGRELLGGPYVTQIGFNPIAPTLLRKALQTLLSLHFSKAPSSQRGTTIGAPSKEVLDVVIESANGDIRSAIMALQFACVVEVPQESKKVKSKKSTSTEKTSRKRGFADTQIVLEAITRREQSLALFHLMGKVLYNKRKGDPFSSSATAKETQKLRDIDAKLPVPPPLPPFLAEHERRASRVDVETLYADSPIDASLFSLYIHQNYTQFCDEVDGCAALADVLSWADASSGEAWYQANPHRFHLLALGTLHALPSPVARRSQKFFKPEFFDSLNKENESRDGVRDTSGWLHTRGSNWGRVEIATELGGVLKAWDVSGTQPLPPSTHRTFSCIDFGRLIVKGSELIEDEAGDVTVDLDRDADAEAGWGSGQGQQERQGNGGWLDSDDIEEF